MSEQNLATLYDKAAPDWGEQVAELGYLNAYGDFARAALPSLRQCMTICDIGTGCGTFALAALKAGILPSNLTLIDPSRKMLAHARQALSGFVPQIASYQTRLEDFQTDHRFDLILGAHVIEHCPKPTRAMAQMFKLLAPGGTLLLIISRPHWCQWLIWLRWRHRWFSENQVRQIAKTASLPDPICHRFTAGPPKRTSFGYVFIRPRERISKC